MVLADQANDVNPEDRFSGSHWGIEETKINDSYDPRGCTRNGVGHRRGGLRHQYCRTHPWEAECLGGYAVQDISAQQGSFSAGSIASSQEIPSPKETTRLVDSKLGSVADLAPHVLSCGWALAGFVMIRIALMMCATYVCCFCVSLRVCLVSVWIVGLVHAVSAFYNCAGESWIH